MKYTMKKAYALLLTLVMLVNIFPVSAFAGTDEARVGSFSLNNSRNAGDESHIVRLVDNFGQYSQNTYVVFMQKIPDYPDYGYWYKKLDGDSWNENVKSFTVPYHPEIECKFNKDEDFQFFVAQKTEYGSDISSGAEWLFQTTNGNSFKFVEAMNVAQANGSIDGQNVTIVTNSAKTETIITIGGEPIYTADFAFVESNGSTTTDLRPEGKYFVVATKDGDSSVQYKAQVTNGELNFGLSSDQGLPKIAEFKVYRYDSGTDSSSVNDIVTNGELIADGGEMGSNNLFALSLPENMSPGDRKYHFIATKIDNYTGARIQFYSDTAGNTPDNNPDTASHYYLVAYEGNTPVAYAAINGNGPLSFVDEDAVVLRSIYTYKLKQHPRTRASETLNTIAADENTVTSLNNYAVNLTPEVVTEGEGQSLLFKATTQQLYRTVFSKKGTAPFNPEGYYFVAYRDGLATAYAPVPDSDQNLNFVNDKPNQDNLSFPEGTIFELVHYEGTGTPTLNDLAELTPVTPKIGEYTIIIPKEPTTEYGNTWFQFTATTTNPMNEIHLKLKEADGTVKAPEPPVTEDYYIRVTVQSYDDGATSGREPGWYDYGWALLHLGTPNTDSGETPVSFSQFVPLDKKWDNQNEQITFDPNIHRIDISDKQAVRLLTIPYPNNLNRFSDCVAGNNGIDDNPPEGYSFEEPGVQEETYGASINLIKEKPKNYQVKVRVEGATSVDDVPSVEEDGSVYVKVTLTHSNGNTYGFVKLTDAMKTTEKGEVVFNVPIEHWVNSNGDISTTDDKITGKETNYKVELVYYPAASGSSHKPSDAGKTLIEGEIINNAKITEEPDKDNPNRVVTVDPTDENRELITDTIKLKIVDNKLENYSLDFLLKKYNVITLCEPNSNEEYGPGDLLYTTHLVGGILVRGDLIVNGVNSIGSSPASTSPSAVGNRIILGENVTLQSTSPLIGGDVNTYKNQDFYIGDENTVYGGGSPKLVYPEYSVQNYGYVNGELIRLNTYGPTVINEDYVNWTKLQNSIIAQTRILAQTSSEAEVINGVAYVQAGQHVVLPDGVTKVVIYSGSDDTNIGWWKDAAGTVVTITSSGDVQLPAVEFYNAKDKDNCTSSRRQEFSGTDNGDGLSLVWNVPEAAGTVGYTSNNAWGHIIAPKANVNPQAYGAGNFNGSMVGNQVELHNEGHMWPYNGGDIIPAELGFKGTKTIDGDKTPEQSFAFTMEELNTSSGEWKKFSDGYNTADEQTITFKGLEYTTTGTHFYRIYENSNQEGVSGITFDTKVYALRVDVSVDPQSGSDIKYKTDITYYVVNESVDKNSITKQIINDETTYYILDEDVSKLTEIDLTENQTSADAIKFNNETQREGLKFKKIVAGSTDTTDIFTFEILLDRAPYSQEELAQYIANHPGYSKDTIPIEGTYDVSGGQEPTITFTDGRATYDVSNGETIIIEGIKVGIHYVISETAINGTPIDNTKPSIEGYLVADALENTAEGNILQQMELIEFTNTEEAKGKITLIKKGKGGAALAGAKFDFYQKGGNADGTDKKLDTGLTTNGEGKIEKDNLDPGTYYFIETEAPAGYVAVPEGGKKSDEVTLAAGQSTAPTATINMTNTEEAKGKITLIKKGKDGAALAGAEFDLYRVKQGEETQDVKINKKTLTTDSNGKIEVEGLDPGTYYFEETKAPSEYVTPEGDNAKTETRIVKAGQETLEPLTINMENTHKVGDLVVSKTVVSDAAADKDQKFTFTIELSDKMISGTYGDMTFEKGVATVELKGGESATAEDLPTGIDYEVTEAVDENFEVTKTGEKGKIVEAGCEAAFTNTRKVGDLTITKTVTSEATVNADQEFTFTIKLSDITINGDYGDMTFTGGVATVTLKHGESATAEGLPCGIEYTVEEVNIPDGYTLESATGDSGEIKADTEVTAEFVNAYTAAGSIVLEASKILTGRTLKADEFSFLLTDADGKTLQEKKNDADGKIVFDEIEYEAADLASSPITYYISEVKGTDPYITYDENKVEITVTLTDNCDGTITAEAVPESKEISFTNKYVRNTSAAVKKVWNDEENCDGMRPLKVTVDLLANGTVIRTTELTEGNHWMAVEKDLPEVDADDKEIAYTWAEREPGSGYKLTGNVKNGTLTTLTNTRDVELTEVSVQKKWNDNGNAANMRPDQIRVQLYANGEACGDAVTLNAGNGWKYTWTGLKKNCDKTAIAYTVEELEVPEGYQVTKSGSAAAGYVLTNTLESGSLVIKKTFDIEEPEPEEEPETELIDINVRKVWDDNNNQDGTRPANITVHLLAGGETIETVQLTEAAGWKHTFSDLPATVRGNRITYSVTEDPVPGYTSEVHGYTIRNTYRPEETSVTVRKVWNDNNNALGIRPTSIRMHLSNGMNVLLSEANGWQATVTGLPKKANGVEINYTWTEQEIVGYKMTARTVQGSVTTFTNAPLTSPEMPEGFKPKVPSGNWERFEEYETPLGVESLINHVGDCFD